MIQEVREGGIKTKPRSEKRGLTSNHCWGGVVVLEHYPHLEVSDSRVCSGLVSVCIPEFLHSYGLGRTFFAVVGVS